MADTRTPQQRHSNMAAIHGKDTKPEMIVRRWLWGHGYHYRLNVKSVPGRADIVMRKYRTAIFVNGCFWHGHGVDMEEGDVFENSKCCKIPKTNREFWVSKIRRNQQRDKENYQMLLDNGWQVIVVWECQLAPKRVENIMREVERLLDEKLLSIYRKRV